MNHKKEAKRIRVATKQYVELCAELANRFPLAWNFYINDHDEVTEMTSQIKYQLDDMITLLLRDDLWE